MNDQKWSWIYGYLLLVAIIVLAAAMALGKVVEATSYGLHEVLLILGLLAANWSNGMFGKKDPQPPEANSAPKP